METEAGSTGVLNLDLAVGVGGIPRGRITEIYGPESSGKTTLCLHVVANAQKEGGTAAFIDAEHALDVQYAKRLGVDTENLAQGVPWLYWMVTNEDLENARGSWGALRRLVE